MLCNRGLVNLLLCRRQKSCNSKILVSECKNTAQIQAYPVAEQISPLP